MLFNSVQFLLFFPIVLLLYFSIPARFKLVFLFLASCIFYISASPLYIFIIFILILIDYFAALIISKNKGNRRKLFLYICLICNIGLLVFFKYFNFFNENISFISNIFGIHFTPSVLSIALPIGLSFHTFQGMSYLIEVYKKKFKPEKSILKYGLFIMFFPQVVAGPIERPQQLLKQFSKKFIFNYANARSGLQLMLWGMFKKVAVADRLAVFIDPIFDYPESHNGLSLGVAAVLFAFQIYYDFSGYTDIARGAALLLGYRLEVNFNNPYMSTSMQEFWRRWHITLSSWFRDYLYIPLGGNRKSNIVTYRNVVITFLLCGLWHGASWHYVIWGLLNGIYLVLIQIWNSLHIKTIRIPIAVSIITTFILTCLTWIFFRAHSVKDAVLIIQKIFLYPFSTIQTSEISQSIFLQQNKFEFLIVIMLIVIIECIHLEKNKVFLFLPMQSKVFRWTIYCSMIWIIILAGFGERSFIYFGF